MRLECRLGVDVARGAHSIRVGVELTGDESLAQAVYGADHAHAAIAGHGVDGKRHAGGVGFAHRLDNDPHRERPAFDSALGGVGECRGLVG